MTYDFDKYGNPWRVAHQNKPGYRPQARARNSADGLSQPLKARADIMLQLSAMTLPHGMVRVLLAEQLYRAYSILNNHPYHRE